MRVSIGSRLKDGPWGGGNQFGQSLVKYLKQQGVEVSFDLKVPDLDIILLTEPRSELSISAFNDTHIFDYLKHVNPRAIVVHRINECDERKGTSGVNARLMKANRCADHTVFVSTWLQNLFLQHGIASRDYSVILNGSDRAIFNAEGYVHWNKSEPLRLVTHHWGANWLKGFDIYQRMDELLSRIPYQSEFVFTYIGNLPEGFGFKHSTYLSPMYGLGLASQLRSHHVYLTASQNEPGGNHQNEGANCGLPLLYRDSGCMPEYCTGYGISFTASDFEEKLQEIRDTYVHWVAKMTDYPHTAEHTAEAYYKLFVWLLENRTHIIKKRSRFSKIFMAFRPSSHNKRERFQN